MNSLPEIDPDPSSPQVSSPDKVFARWISIFKMGGLLNQARWHLEQSFFSGRSEHWNASENVRDEVVKQAILLAPSVSINVFLKDKMEDLFSTWKNHPQSEDFQEYLNNLHEAIRQDDLNGNEPLVEVLSSLGDFKEKVVRLIQNQLGFSPFEHDLFLFGSLLDQGLRPPDVWKLLFVWTKERWRNRFQPQPARGSMGNGFGAVQRRQMARYKPVNFFSVKTIRSGQCVPEKQWIYQLIAALRTLGLLKALPPGLRRWDHRFPLALPILCNRLDQAVADSLWDRVLKNTTSYKPVWSKSAKKLWFGNILCCEYPKKTAYIQELILNGFQEKDWPDQIEPPDKSEKLDNALPGDRIRAKSNQFKLNKLNDGLKELQKKLRNGPIVIEKNGEKDGLKWRIRPDFFKRP